MKTKRLLFSICVGLPLMAGLTACTSDETTEAKPAQELLVGRDDGSQASPGAADGGEECFYARLRDQLAGED